MPNRPILIVDDEPGNLATLRQILAPEHALVFARSGAEAMAAVAKHRPALILLDIRMPDIDGYDLCRQLKAEEATRDTPVIFITALSDVAQEAAGFEAGGVDYIVKPVSPPTVRARVRTHLSLVRATVLENSYRTAIYMLGEAGHYNDDDTGVHIWRMAAYARRLAEACGWTTDRAEMLELAAPMHDTGKIGIPHTILRKPGKLDAQEWEVMRTHPRIGHDILTKSDAPVFQLAAQIALCHHERWDGTGYPGGLAGTAIPESARVVAVADVFDALSSPRPYKEAWPLDRVMTTLHDGAGTHFDPQMVAHFERILPAILEIQLRWDRQELKPHVRA